VDAPEKWPAAFLVEAVPAAFMRALLERKLAPRAELRVSSMVPESFDPLLATLPPCVAHGQARSVAGTSNGEKDRTCATQVSTARQLDPLIMFGARETAEGLASERRWDSPSSI